MTDDPPVKRGPGRPKGSTGPTLYNEDMALEICEWISEGKSLRSFCAQPGKPIKITVMRWLRRYPEFVELYKIARQEMVQSLVDEMMDVARDENQDPKRSRLIVDTMKWMASKVMPKVYGEKLEITTTDRKPDQLSDEELAAIASGSSE